MNNNLSPNTTIALMQATQGDVNGPSRTSSTRDVKNIEKIEAAAQDFEAVFLTEMMKPMFEGVGNDPLFGGGKGEEVFNDVLLQEYGKLFAETGGIGIADHVKKQMIEIQSRASLNQANDGESIDE